MYTTINKEETFVIFYFLDSVKIYMYTTHMILFFPNTIGDSDVVRPNIFCSYTMFFFKGRFCFRMSEGFNESPISLKKLDKQHNI